MTSVGETLRRERLRRNLALDQISRELKINAKMLEAIEAEEFDKLPGTIFAKNFVRQYAHLLGLDEDEMAAEVQRALQPPSEIPRFAESGKAAPVPIQVTPIHLPRVEQWESTGDRGFSWGSPLPALALFVVAMLVCSGVYAWYQRTRHPVLAQNTAVTEPAPGTQSVPPALPPAPVQQPQVPQSEASPPAAPPQTQPAHTPAVPGAPAPGTSAQNPPPPRAAAAPPVAPVTAPTGAITVRVQITAEEPSWVLVRTDGKFLFSGTMEANQTRTVEASKNLELRLGNAGGVTVVLNGKAIGAMGPKGQVRTVQFTSGGFQIVAAPKPVPLIDPL
ncbi:MAG: helix-turn-helix domain-containing protein [Candidatus Sulfopaludibacter sp.]|nr:helix-turn-helix domain-containing protein [Candidatus Sulfopaludibacter sp.]